MYPLIRDEMMPEINFQRGGENKRTVGWDKRVPVDK